MRFYQRTPFKCFCQAKIAAFDHEKSRQWGEKGKRVIVENRGI